MGRKVPTEKIQEILFYHAWHCRGSHKKNCLYVKWVPNLPFLLYPITLQSGWRQLGFAFASLSFPFTFRLSLLSQKTMRCGHIISVVSVSWSWWGWSGGAKVLGKLSVPGRPTSLDDSRARAYCACSRCGWGFVWTFFLSSIFSLLFLPLFGRRLDIDWNTVSKGR